MNLTVPNSRQEIFEVANDGHRERIQEIQQNLQLLSTVQSILQFETCMCPHFSVPLRRCIFPPFLHLGT
jgi:hypothetical protein